MSAYPEDYGTCYFSDSGVLATCMIAFLFFWHTQQRSDIGFMTVMCGISYLHSEQKVVYAAGLSPVSSQASLYSIQTAYSTHVRHFIV